MFFVLGAPKSGTTWLQRMLDQHPALLCTGEGQFHDFGKALGRAGGEYNQALKSKNMAIFGREIFPPLTQPEFQAVFRAFVLARLQAQVRKPGVLWLGNKDPDHATHFEMMANCFPEARYIHLLRDGRDVAVSAWFHLQRCDPRLFQKYRSIEQMADWTAKRWAESIRKVRQTVIQRRIAYVEVRYEDLRADGPARLHRLLEFLEVERDPETIAACLAASSFERMSGGRAAGDEDSRSFFRKGVSGDWRNHFDEATGKRFCALTEGLMEELGYA